MTGTRISRSLTICAIALALTAFASVASAQVGQIKGKVVDAQNKPVEGAKVTIQQQGGQNRKYEVKTDGKGEFRQIGIIAGVYAVQAEKDKLSERFDNVNIGVNETKEVNFALKPGSAMTKEENEKRVAGLQAKFAEAITLSRAGKHDQAAGLLNEVLAAYPQCGQCYVAMGEIHVQKKEIDAAEKAYKKAIEVAPNEALPYQSLASFYNTQGKFKESAEMSAEAAKRSAAEPGGGGRATADALYSQAVSLWNSGDAKKAEELLSQAAKADPTHAEVHFLRGNVLVKIGSETSDLTKFSDAVGAFEMYLKLAPNGPNADRAKKSFEELKSFKK